MGYPKCQIYEIFCAGMILVHSNDDPAITGVNIHLFQSHSLGLNCKSVPRLSSLLVATPEHSLFFLLFPQLLEIVF